MSRILDKATLEIPQVHWTKSAGEDGNVGFTLLIEKNHLHAKDINVELGKLKTSGNVELDMKGPVMSLTMEHLSLSYDQLKGIKLQRSDGNNFQFTVQGGEISLAPFLHPEDRVIDAREKKVEAESEAIVKQLESNGITFDVGLSKLDRVYINKDTYFDNVQFSGHKDGKGWQEVSLSAHNAFADGTDDYRRSTHGARQARFQTVQDGIWPRRKWPVPA